MFSHCSDCRDLNGLFVVLGGGGGGGNFVMYKEEYWVIFKYYFVTLDIIVSTILIQEQL